MDAKTFQPQHFQLLHQLKRRIRIFVPGLRGDQERAYIFAIILKKRPEITFVKTVPAIGSVTLYFDAKKLPKANLLILLDAVLSNFGKKK
jgi:Cu+-exporting ATPase